MAKRKKSNGETVVISAPNEKTAIFKIVGTSPYVQQKFSEKAKAKIRATQEAGGTGKKSTKKLPKDFEECYQQAQYKPSKGVWPNGAIPATAIRAAMISACRLTDFVMTSAKQCLYVECDGFDPSERIPLIKITKGKPQRFEQALSGTKGGADIRIRPLWEPGWESIVRIRYDADRFTLTDVANLLMRAGCQVGIGEGRQASRSCAGLGWGAFEIASKKIK